MLTKIIDEWHRIRDREWARVTYRFRIRVRLTVKTNFYVRFADGVFDNQYSVDMTLSTNRTWEKIRSHFG